MYMLLGSLLSALAINALAFDSSIEMSPTGAVSEFMGKSMDDPSVYPAWLEPAAYGAFVEAIPFSSSQEDLDENTSDDFQDGNNSYSTFVGRFSSFYLKNLESFAGACEQAISLNQCQGLLWQRARVVFSQKLYSSTERAINRLLFLEDNPYLKPVKLPKGEFFAMLEGQSPGLATFIEKYKTEYNRGRYRVTLYNSDPDYLEAAPLLGSITPAGMNALLLDAQAKTLFESKLGRAKKIYDLEWKLFVKNILIPHTILVSAKSLASKALYLDAPSANFKINNMSLAVCQKAPPRLLNSPELYRFCSFLHQLN